VNLIIKILSPKKWTIEEIVGIEIVIEIGIEIVIGIEIEIEIGIEIEVGVGIGIGIKSGIEKINERVFLVEIQEERLGT